MPLRSYASVLEDQREFSTPELQRAVVAHLHDLIALTLGASRDAAEVAANRGVRAARLRAVKADIVRHLKDQSFNVTGLAARHGITPRYVQKLFEREGLTFSQFLLDQRLARAHRLLGDPGLSDRTISVIAFECGFGDLSHFNRAFRRRYGETPSDVRSSARRSSS